MSKVDWSLAPEWAGAVVSSKCETEFFVEKFGIRSKRQKVGSEHLDCEVADMTMKSSSWYLIEERPKQPQSWSGPEDGLPPVGFRCEAGIPHTSGPDNEVSIIWIEGSVIAYCEIKGNTYAWFAEDDGLYPPAMLEFRAIKTPEQLAADQRESAIRELMDIAQVDCRVTAARLVDAGFKREVV